MVEFAINRSYTYNPMYFNIVFIRKRHNFHYKSKMHKIRIYTKICMSNKQKMQNYDYFDILDFKDRSDRDRIAIRP